MLPIGGSGSQLTSECHSSPATYFDFSSALMISISGWSARTASDEGMDVQLAEAAAERLVLLVRQLLVAEEDHQVLHQRVMDLLEGLVAERPGKVDAGNLRADAGRKLAHLRSSAGPSAFPLAFCASLREKKPMSDTLVLRAATIADAPAIAATIAAAFEQYRGKLVPESGAFRETADAIAAELAQGRRRHRRGAERRRCWAAS